MTIPCFLAVNTVFFTGYTFCMIKTRLLKKTNFLHCILKHRAVPVCPNSHTLHPLHVVVV